jgi:hypothetical protein
MMLHPVTETPFLIDADNAPFLAGRGLAVPQRHGSGAFDLVIGGLVGGASLLLPVGIIILGIYLTPAAAVVAAAGVGGVLVFAAVMLRSGWRALQQARTCRTRARRVNGTITALELVDEGGGDWFLRGVYQFEDDTGHVRQGQFSQYRPDLVGKSLPPSGAAALVLYVDEHNYAIL